MDLVAAWLSDSVEDAVRSCDGDCVSEFEGVDACVIVCEAVQLIVGVTVRTTDVVIVGDCVCVPLAPCDEVPVVVWLEVSDVV